MDSINEPLVTIGIPTYNRANFFLQNALNCVVNQTYKNIEIIVSDNCSTDNTEAIVRGFSDPRIHYVKHQENIGANNNFNYCVNAAKGRYFVLLHDDDRIDDDMVEACIQSLPAGKDVGVIFTGNRVIDEKGNIMSEVFNRGAGLSSEKFLIGWFNNNTALYLCSTMFNTQRLKEIGGFHSKRNLFQDVVAEVILLYKYGRSDVYDVKASFRRHSGNTVEKPGIFNSWIVDCRYLMNLILRMATTDKERLRDSGLAFFKRFNYSIANSIKSPLERKIAMMKLNLYFYNYHKLPQKILRRISLK